MEWIINSYDRRTDRDGQNRFTTEAAFSGPRAAAVVAIEDQTRKAERVAAKPAPRFRSLR
jgi:hypothetical protein